ncbi:MAG: cupin domain-containing protein [Actinomycetota bacterium]|nr:cupin domain-containing protein [Actinomycetota bacterium]
MKYENRSLEERTNSEVDRHTINRSATPMLLFNEIGGRVLPERHVRSFSTPDDVIELESVRSEIVSLGGIAVAQTTHQPGWRWSTHVQPVVGTETCQTRHVGYVLKGTVHVVLDDGTEFDISAGDVVDIRPGHDAWVLGDEPAVTIEWMGARSWIPSRGALTERVLATLVFTDIVDSTGTARRMGAHAWDDLITAYEQRVRDSLARFRGREVKQTGDGVLATFDGAGRAIRCAVALRGAAWDLGLTTRAAVHTGEVEVADEDIHGLTVHKAARILAAAGPGEILVSATTTELARDASLDFEDRGEHHLRGLEGSLHLYAVRGA